MLTLLLVMNCILFLEPLINSLKRQLRTERQRHSYISSLTASTQYFPVEQT